MHRIKTAVLGCTQRARTQSERYGGVQTYIWMVEDNVVEVPFDREHLLETILSPANLNKAYKAVVKNKGCCGIDRMSCEEFLPWLLANKGSLICSLMDGCYHPNPVRRVECVKYLGYSFYISKGKCELRVHPKAETKMRTRLKELTGCSNGMGYDRRTQKLKEYVRGWIGYYHLANMKRLLIEIDECLRRRIRMCKILEET